jgi:hypothetical protein
MEPEYERFAARCRYLKMTLDSRHKGEVMNLCLHIVRDGSRCVGPFLDDTETNCGLWEPSERYLAAPIKAPLAE